MKAHPFLLKLLVLSITITALHFFAAHFELYLDIWWFDLLMHFLGGAVIGGIILVLYRWRGRYALSTVVPYKIYAISLVAVLVVGLLWELFEYYLDLVYTDEYVLDTTLDLIFDVIGGVSVTWYALKEKLFAVVDRFNG